MFTPPGARDCVYPPEARHHFRGYEAVFKEDRRRLKSRAWHSMAKLPRWRKRFHKALRNVLRKRAELFVRLLEQLEWDLFVACFTSTDRLQHECWLTIDGSGTEAWRTDESRMIEEFLADLDAYLAALISRTDARTNVILVSDHGFGPAFSADYRAFRINTWLSESGYITMKSSSNVPTAGTRGCLYRSARYLARFFLSPPQRKRIRNLVRGDRDDPENQILWDESCAFAAQVEQFGCLYLNKTCLPGHRCASLTDDLMLKLRDVRSPRDGQPVFSRVDRATDIYEGPYADRGPGIIVQTRWPCFLSYVMAYPVHADYQTNGVTTIEGRHRQQGIFVARGPAFQPAGDGEWSIQDVAPTVLAALGLPYEPDMDGRPIAQEVPGGPAEPTASASVSPRRKTANMWQSAHDEDQVKRHLKDLGYL